MPDVPWSIFIKTKEKQIVANQTKFVIYKDAVGGFRWRLVAGNGEKVAASESYTQHQTAVNSAYRVKEIANEAIVVTEVPKDEQ